MLTNRLANGREAGTGMLGGQLSAGTLIAGWGRVAGKAVGGGPNGQWVTVTREVTVTRRGKTRTRIGDPRTYLVNERVPGTQYRTDLPAGPVGREPGRHQGRANGYGVGETRAERHASMISNLSYR